MKEELAFLCSDFLHSLNPKKPDWLEHIKDCGKVEQVPILHEDTGITLKLLCSLLQPKNILEVGCGFSFSTHWMLLGAPNSKIDAIDMNGKRLERCIDFLKKSGFSDNVDLHCTNGLEFLESTEKNYDLIFLDSIKKDYQYLLEPSLNHLNEGGYLIVDNILFGGRSVRLEENDKKKYTKGVEALNYFNQMAAEHPKLECSFLNVGDGLLVAKKSTI